MLILAVALARTVMRIILGFLKLWNAENARVISKYGGMIGRLKAVMWNEHRRNDKRRA